MNQKLKAQIKAFVKERDAVLLSGDLDRVIAFHRKHSPTIPIPDRLSVEIAMHKSRTAVKTFPMAARLSSRRWLVERGYSSMDDGDLV